MRALVLAQGISAQATAEFISEVGFVADPRARDRPAVRTVQFSHVRPVADPENPGQVINTPVVVTAPLLALTSIPNLRIAEGTVTFDADVIEAEPAERRRPAFAIEGRPPSVIPSPPLRFLAALVPRAPEEAPQGPGGNLSITVKFRREPLAEGLTRILTLLQDAVTAEPEPQ